MALDTVTFEDGKNLFLKEKVFRGFRSGGQDPEQKEGITKMMWAGYQNKVKVPILTAKSIF